MSNDHGEIVIEFSAKKNENIFFDPLGKIVRGTLDISKVMSKGKSLPTVNIPGMRAGLTISRKRARLFDPLDFPSNQGLVDKINERQQRAPAPTIKPASPETFESLTDNQMATWLYWFKRYVDTGKAFHVAGSAKLEGVEIPGGDPMIDNFHDSSHNAPRRLSEFKKIFHSDGNTVPEPMVAVEKQGTAGT